MMSLSTSGRDTYPNREVPVCIADTEGLAYLDDKSRAKLLLLKEGNGMLSNGSHEVLFIAPVLLVLDHERAYQLKLNCKNVTGSVIFFHPKYLNDALDFNSFRVHEQLPRTDRQDFYLIRHFAPEKMLGEKIISLGPAEFKYLDYQFKCVAQQLQEQVDWYWPCRARSFFIQILITLDSLILQKEAGQTENTPLTEDVPWIFPVDLDEKLKSIFQYLINNYQEKLTIQELARHFNTNRTTLQAKFKSITGMSIAQYLIRLRVHVASILLKDTSLTVQEIIERTGFEDPTHFTRMFKRYANLNPSGYRALFKVPAYLQPL